MDMSAFNYVDYAVFAILIASGILATFRGFSRELLGVIGWFIAVLFARITQEMITEQVEDYINDSAVAEFLGWMLPFAVAVLAWFVFANMAASSLKKFAMGGLDRPLGFVFGVLRGLVIVAVIYMSALVLTEDEDAFPETVLNAASISPVRVVATMMTGFAPEDMRDDLKDAIPEQDLDDIKDGFINKAEDAAEDAIDNADDTAKNVGDLLPDELNTPE